MSSSTAVPTPDSTIMKRLGYIRLHYLQAVTHSYAPAPLNFSAVLAFHDVMESFFIVAVDHVGRDQGVDFKKPFTENVKKVRAPDGNPLYGRDVVGRIGHDRNGFKHYGSIPGKDQVEQARRDATAFLEGNCPRLFGVEFSDVSMLHIVPQDAVRAHLMTGRVAADAGDVKAGMAEVALAFDRLIAGWGTGKYLPGSSFFAETFHFDAHDYRLSRRRIEAFPRPSDQSIRAATDSLASSVKEAFKDIDKELETLRRALRIQIAGVEMAGYVRFAMIAPEIIGSANGDRDVVHRMGQLHYTPENYSLCETFVVDSALRISQSDSGL